MALRVGNDGEVLVDFTVGGVCCKSHWDHQGVRAGIAKHIADDVKATKHRVFEATPDVLVGIGFDSRGGMSKTTRDLHKRLFATEGWRSQALRAWVYRTHLTRISAVLWKRLSEGCSWHAASVATSTRGEALFDQDTLPHIWYQ